MDLSRPTTAGPGYIDWETLRMTPRSLGSRTHSRRTDTRPADSDELGPHAPR
jgi:hypothetical protein